MQASEFQATWESRRERLDAELRALEQTAVDPRGERMSPGPSPLPPGWSWLLDPDPLGWGVLLRSLPEVRTLQRDLVHGEARVPEAAALEALDARYRAHELPPPTAPFRAGPPPEATRREAAVHFLRETGLLRREDPFLVRVRDALLRGEREFARRDAALLRVLEDGVFVEGLERWRLPTPFEAMGGLRHVLERSGRSAEARRRLWTWATPGAVEAHRVAVACHRHLAQELADPAADARLCAAALPRLMTFHRSYLLGLTIPQILRSESRGAAQLFFESELRRRWIQARLESDLPLAGALEERVAVLRRARTAPLVGSPPARRRLAREMEDLATWEPERPRRNDASKDLATSP